MGFALFVVFAGVDLILSVVLCVAVCNGVDECIFGDV
jgi:hypothetical protein